MNYKNPTSKGGKLLKKVGDYASHPDYQPGKMPDMSGNKVRDVGDDNFNAPSVGRVNEKPGQEKHQE